jgi:negative regulator of flagellin synthesis FlgM
MKIGNTAPGIHEPAPATPAVNGRTTPDDTAKAAPGAAADSSATVEISSTAAGLRSSIQGATAEFDADKVRRISQGIADGTFKVNPEAIADKLIANAQELLANGKR